MNDHGRQIAGAARRLLAVLEEAGDRYAEARDLRAQLQAWDAADNPPLTMTPTSMDEQRATYLGALQLALEASGDMPIGAFGDPALATRAARLRARLTTHVEQLSSAWNERSRF